MSHSRYLTVARLIVVIGLVFGLFGVPPWPVARAAAIKTGVPGAYSICVRPGGTSRAWSFGNDSTPDPAWPGIYPITQISYHNVGAPINWTLWRGNFQYSTDGGSSWLPYTVSSSTNFVTVSGKIWRFVDTASADTTTANSIGVAWFLQGPPTNVGSGATIIPDNAPTDISSSTNSILVNTGAGTAVATLTPTDTGCTTDGYWVIDSQSVPNLFTISFDAATGNSATLSLGTGSQPAAGQSATVTVRYYDLYQTDGSGVPISGQGFSRQLTFNFVADQTQDLNFSNDAAASTVTPVYSGYGKPQAATLSTGNYVAVWTEFGHGGDAMASTGASYDYGGLYGRQFDSTGTATAAVFAVTPVGDGVDTYQAAIAPLNTGRYVVAYQRSTASNGYDIGYRIVEANGAVGSELTANTTVAGDQTTPAIATLTDGSFMIAWNSAGSILAQQFNAADGSKSGSELSIHADTADLNPAIAALSNGDYALAWGNGSTGNISAIVGSAPGSVITVSSDGAAWSAPEYAGPRPRVAGLTGGGFVITWDSYANDMVGWTVTDVFFQRYTNAGTAQGGIVQANTGAAGFRFNPSVAPLSGGGFVIGWQSDIGDYDYNGIFGRRFTATGTAVDTGDFEINQYRKGDQIMPYLTSLSSDLFAAVWEAGASLNYPSTPGIYTRVLLPTGPATCTGIGSGTVNWTVAFAACPPGAKYVIPVGLNVILDADIALDVDLEVLGTLDATSQQKTLTLTGSGNQTLTGNPLNFYNLTINKTNKTDTVTVSGKLKVTKKLTVTKGKLKSASDYGNVEIGVDGTLELTNDITVGGTWINNGDFIANTAQVAFDGTAPQAIGGTNPTRFYRLVISPTAGIFITTTPAITDTVINYGVLSQTQTVNNNTVNFLQFSATKYQGVDITTADDLGAVTVAVSGEHAVCTGDAGSPDYRNRCFRVNVERADMSTATMIFYTTAAEDDLTGDIAYQYYPAFPLWAEVGDAPCDTTDGEACTASSVTVEVGDNFFLIGGVDAPTAVTLRNLSAADSAGQLDLSVLPLAAVLLLGLSAWWLTRRVVAYARVLKVR